MLNNSNDLLKLFIIDVNDLEYYKQKDRNKYNSRIKEIAENYIFASTERTVNLEHILYFFEHEIENQHDIYVVVKDKNDEIAEINVVDKNNRKINTGFYKDLCITGEFNSIKLRMPRHIEDTDKLEVVFQPKKKIKNVAFEINNIIVK